MIEVNEVTRKAIDYLKSFYPEAERVQLEEIELSEDKKVWNVTISFESQDTHTGSVLVTGKSKKYKVFKIESKSGDVVSMKVRTF